jgi:hypothetical protein
MRLVVIESPFRTDSDEGFHRNGVYARMCVRDCLLRGESPMLSHLLFTQPGVLDDSKPEERALGIKAGHAWLRGADAVVVYEDLGISAGMLQGIEAAKKLGKPIKRRALPWANDALFAERKT